MNRIEELKELITKYDTAYRKGDKLVEDSVYDALVDELTELIGEEDEFFDSSIKEDDEEVSARREALPEGAILASMSKVKTVAEIRTWMRLKGIPDTTQFVLSPKYDGISLLKEESTKKAWTKGSKDNSGGLRSDVHLQSMNDNTFNAPFTFGEVIISRENWEKAKESFEGDSARNGVAGLFRRDYASEELQYVDFIRYGVIGKEFKFKNELFDFLNSTQKVKVPYVLATIDVLTEDYLKSVFVDFAKNYELDGLIIEVNDISKWEDLGRERNNNPKWARAYKGNFEEVGETVCIAIEDNISKDGNIIPVAILEPIKLDGAVVSRVTMNNYSFLKEMGVGVGSRVKVKRSGGVIPLIVEVLNKIELKLPDIECEWNGVHLKTLIETDEQKKKKNLAFFRILDVEDFSEKTIDLLFDSGYKSIADILNMSKKDFQSLERFGERKADKIYDAIHKKMNNIPLNKLMHSTGVFKLLGSKKLALVEHFETKPTISEIMSIEGFSEISANNFIEGYDLFWEFIKDLPITWKRKEKIEISSNDFAGRVFVFTGVRDKNSENILVSKGATIGSGVSSKTTDLIVKEKGSGSSKETKAIELGINIMTLDELKDIL